MSIASDRSKIVTTQQPIGIFVIPARTCGPLRGTFLFKITIKSNTYFSCFVGTIAKKWPTACTTYGVRRIFYGRVMDFLDISKLLKLTVAAFVVCTAALAGLLKPHFANTKLDSCKGLVIVFYANETDAEGAYFENINRVQSWLRAYEDDYSKSYKNWFEQDLVEFSRSVDRQISDLSQAVGRLDKKADVQLVVFTNRLAKQKSYAVYSKNKLVLEPFSTKTRNSFTISSPLSQLSSFELALAKVQKRFDSKEYNFALITKSHGDLDYVIRPKVMIDTKKITKYHFELAYRRHIKKKTAFAQKSVVDGILRLGDKKLGDRKESIEMSSLEKKLFSRPSLNSKSVTKEQYIAAIQKFSKESSLLMVFMDACESQLDSVQLKNFGKKSIYNIYTSDEDGLEYEHLDYAESLRSADSTNSFIRSLIIGLDSQAI